MAKSTSRPQFPPDLEELAAVVADGVPFDAALAGDSDPASHAFK